jgi:hypothetical protein
MRLSHQGGENVAGALRRLLGLGLLLRARVIVSQRHAVDQITSQEEPGEPRNPERIQDRIAQ